MEIWIVSAVLVVTFVLLVTEKISVDITAIGVIATLALSGILTPVEAVAGFANPAVITVAAMFLISKGMTRTGAVALLSDRVITAAGGSGGKAMLLMLLMTGVSSAFINNTPIVVLFIPVIMSMGCRFGLHPSKFLIPLSYVSILGGTCTLIGTSTNIIVSDLSARFGYGAFTMFELSKVGVPLALLGIGFLMVAGPRLLPGNTNPACELERADRKKYLTEIRIGQGSRLLGQHPPEFFREFYPSIDAIELIRRERAVQVTHTRLAIMEGDHILVKGNANDLVLLLQETGVAMPYPENPGDLGGIESKNITVEIIIPPQSDLIGQRLREIFLFNDPGIHVIAVERSGLHYTETKLRDIRLKIGDILLVSIPWRRLEEVRAHPDFIVVEDVYHKILHRNKARRAMLIFAGMVVLASTGILNIMVAALTAVVLMLLTQCLQIRESYRALQGDVLVLIAGTIALGAAMEKTGASRFYADLFLGLVSNFSPHMILGVFILLTSISTQLLSNNATAVLLLPIAVSTALKLGVDPKAFIVGVCFGASACFATPIGYQTNLLVYGPGGYRFADYMKLGIPLNLIIIVAATWMIPFFWPLQ
ncbi:MULTISPECIES: SLC13 family permease [Desulfococcus]|jgi:di/tricarboxylate transporter|uniref:Citrate transporter n=1 Tax=Desulfococcus multivorans DSM 2059 TaxID=1121405 RepID=S7TXU1_DESML|nr:SLC13 family permease [Desulfococcus multivorans]AOY56898.1 putative citrate transporter [Desulfococcus multivorans]AQU99432.1 SLC13 family permease [Desulfococcus multivorans]EPR41916.1 Citrate transporter [Desulfococcus multivorans DSM 2059]SJZ94560.1 Di-and tricarboxylate transporter [Desulfococcus multivorans DSM 2059]